MAENISHFTFGDIPDYSQTALSRAFRALAKKIHPDRNPLNIEEFKEVTQIYKIMNTPELRRVYYKFGSRALQMDTMVFSEDSHKPSKCNDTVFELAVSDDDLKSGCVKKLRVIKQQPINIAMTNERYWISKSHIIAEGSPKPTLDLVGVITMMKSLIVDVAKGMDYGQKITLKGEGEGMPRHTPGDLIVVLVKKQEKVDEQQNSSKTDESNDQKCVEPTKSSPK